jgi:iron(III) transport system ATP-binding protein
LRALPPTAQADVQGFSAQARGRASAVIPADLGVEGVTKAFGGRTVLSDLTLSIAAAEVICLLGPSGCGKTTLLRLIAGMETLDRGRILLDGREISTPTHAVAPDKRGIGLVFQDYALFPHMSVRDNVAFGLRGLSRAEQEATAGVALSRVGLSALAGSLPYMLSGGEQQRVALARAIVPRPRVLLMDEPFSNLDRRMRDAVREDTVALLRETGATCIMVTHDPEEAMRIADRIVLMRTGRIVQAGPPEELYRRPADLEAARFFCDLNELPAKVSGGQAETPFGRMAAPGVADGRAALCIRPQGLRLLPAGEGIPARIRAVRFLGEMHLVELDVAGVDQPLRARVREKPPSGRKREVGLAIDLDEVLVFGQERP